jgi:Protein of unknown function (DUF1360)
VRTVATATKDGARRRRSPGQEPPLAGYSVLAGSFAATSAAFAAWMRASGRKLPSRVDPGDLALITIATHKAARVLAKDRVTSAVRAPFTRLQEDAGPGEVAEAARGRGLPRAVGELLVCPYCLGMWVGAGFTAGLIAAPRQTRWIASVFAVVFGADLLQIGYRKAEKTL